jgi:hypothetical protein
MLPLFFVLTCSFVAACPQLFLSSLAFEHLDDVLSLTRK